MKDVTTTTSFLDVNARLAEVIPNYEDRPEQIEMATTIEKILAANLSGADLIHALIEAGCGTGKSLGYLIPLILSGLRGVVSTATLALQDQIVDKDLPMLQEFLREQFDIRFSFALLKGRTNYLCPARARSLDPSEVPNLASILTVAEEGYSLVGFSGERNEFPDMTDAEWRKVCGHPDDCKDNRCKDGSECYAQRARAAAKEAQIVVVNHMLMLTDLQLREMTGGVANMLEAYDVAIFDEAHEIEDWAGKALGKEFTEGTIRAVLAEVRNFVDKTFPESVDDIRHAADQVLGAMAVLWPLLDKVCVDDRGRPTNLGRIRERNLLDDQEAWISMVLALNGYAEALAEVNIEYAPVADLTQTRKRLRSLKARAMSTASRFQSIVMDDFSDSVRWVEIERNTDSRFGDRRIIKTCPINVSAWLRKNLFSETPCILTSATMEVNGSMDFIAGRLGIDAFQALNVGSPFDFATQAQTYVAADLPDPKVDRVAYDNLMIRRMADLVTLSDGRALLLFTSLKAMRAARDVIAMSTPHNVMMQGEAPTKVLAARFAADTHSVLLGTRSFFTGVDFQGQTCSLVAVDKLPFPVPSEPLFEARCDDIIARHGDAFLELSIPMMILPLKQGQGRLIRHRDDRGVFALLDPRVKGPKKKGFGAAILRSLPNAPVVTDLGAVKAFFQDHAVVVA